MRPARPRGRARPPLPQQRRRHLHRCQRQGRRRRQANRYYGLTPLFIDVNNDGKPDLLVADDSTPNYLYLNKGDGTFEDASFASGYALNEDGRETAAMGIAAGDYINNGLLDSAITDFSDDYKLLYRNDGDGNFTEISPCARASARAPFPSSAGATGFLDYDNDGWLDLMMVNGHVYPRPTAELGHHLQRSGRCSSTTRTTASSKKSCR